MTQSTEKVFFKSSTQLNLGCLFGQAETPLKILDLPLSTSEKLKLQLSQQIVWL